MKLVRLTLCVMFAFFVTGGSLFADDISAAYVPTRYGLSVTCANTFNPNSETSFVALTGIALFDYDRVWPHEAPEQLRFKIELSPGITARPNMRAIISGGMFAVYYLDALTTGTVRPYVEGGVGVIYTDFKVEGQGSKLNFNPQFGVGTEFLSGPFRDYFIAVRLHHVSNAGLNKHNQGIDSATLSLGFYF